MSFFNSDTNVNFPLLHIAPLLSPYHEESGEKEHKRKDDRLHTPAVPSISKDHRDPHPVKI